MGADVLSGALLMFFFGCFVMAAAIFVGRKIRVLVHAILPSRDPVMVFTVLSEGVMVLLLTAFGISVPTALVVALAAWDAGYVLGYMTAPQNDVVYLDMPDESLTSTEIGPFVYYVKDGALFHMPQTLKAVLFSMLGARHPLDMALGGASRTRTVVASNGILSLGRMTVLPVAIHAEEPFEVGVVRIGSRKIKDLQGNVVTFEPRHAFTTTVFAQTIRFSREIYDDPLAFYTKTGIYKTAISKADEAVEKATRMEIQMQTSTFDAGAQVVAGLISLQEDAPGTREDILEAVRAERARRAKGRSADEIQEAFDGQDP